MDELEFRRRAYANPNDTNVDFSQAQHSSERNGALVAQLQQFDAKLSCALQEPVPEHLAASLLQTAQLHAQASTPLKSKQSSVLGWRHLAIAASITFVLGFSTRFISFSELGTSNITSMGQMAMAHVHAESPLTQTVNENVTLTAVNAKLQPYGTQLQNLNEVGQVYYANHCLFGDASAAHLVIQGEYQRVHVFVLPPDRELVNANRVADKQYFSDQQYHGEILSTAFNKLVVVSEKNENLDVMARKIQASLDRQI